MHLKEPIKQEEKEWTTAGRVALSGCADFQVRVRCLASPQDRHRSKILQTGSYSFVSDLAG